MAGYLKEQTGAGEKSKIKLLKLKADRKGVSPPPIQLSSLMHNKSVHFFQINV